jgi:hypothetical protein
VIRPWILATCLLAVLAGGFFVFCHRNKSAQSTDNGRASPVATKSMTPTLVGRQVCRECHQESYQLHRHSGHASTFATTRGSDLAEVFVGKTVDAGKDYGQFAYDMAGDGLRTRRLSDSKQVWYPPQRDHAVHTDLR